MRSGGCAVQQALTPEAAGVVKQAVVLAKRRGHSQVTPLHVANTMMGAGGGGGGGGGASLLRAACLQSHSHPLQCKALELCFNVALNRLPAAASSCSPAAHHSPYPSISNALVAAFKRAQAQQRRGSDSNNSQQQQAAAALLTVKIELDQLIVSILDDPSVSRVMREAGFSSTQVKNNVEKAISHSSHASRNFQEENRVVVLDPSSPPSSQNDDDEDLKTITEALIGSKRNRNLVVVGESISKVEKTVEKLMERVEREAAAVPENLREVKFITFPPFYTFCNVRRELVQQKIQELAFLVRSVVGKGVVLYLGDLNWISEYRVSLERSRERSYYCSVEHMIMEVGRLVSGFAEIGRLWLMGIATFQTYMKCRNGYNSLQMIWRLHPITMPADTLGLSLVPHSNENGGEERNEKEENGDDCSHDCSSRLEEEEEAAQDLENGATLMSSLPPWLKSNYNHQNFDSFENKQLKLVERTLTLFTPSPSSSTSCFSIDQISPNSLLPSNPSSITNSPSSAEAAAVAVAAGQKFTEFNTNNLNILCNALEEKVPWQKEIIPEIAGTVLQCRSRMLRRKGNHDPKEETWLFFLGPDVRGKEEISRNLAKFVFGSYSDFVSVGVEGFARAVSDNPHRVFLVEGLEVADRSSWMMIKRAIERGRVRSENGEEVGLFDGIVVLSCERFRYSFEEKMGNVKKVEDVSLDLNMCFGDDDVENMHDLGIVENVDRVVDFKI